MELRGLSTAQAGQAQGGDGAQGGAGWSSLSPALFTLRERRWSDQIKCYIKATSSCFGPAAPGWDREFLQLLHPWAAFPLQLLPCIPGLHLPVQFPCSSCIPELHFPEHFWGCFGVFVQLWEVQGGRTGCQTDLTEQHLDILKRPQC